MPGLNVATTPTDEDYLGILPVEADDDDPEVIEGMRQLAELRQAKVASPELILSQVRNDT